MARQSNWLFVGILATVSCNSAAYAQVQGDIGNDTERASDVADRIDIDIPAVDRLGLVEEIPKNWLFVFELPATFNTNAIRAEGGGPNSAHAVPTAVLKRTWSVSEAAKFSMLGGAAMDIYTETPEADQSLLIFAAQLDIGDPDKSLAVNGSYKPLVAYSGQFDDHLVTIHRLSVGASRNFKLSETDKLAFSASFERREATVSAVEQFRYSLDAKMSGQITPKVGWNFGGTLVRADFTGGTNDGRNDDNLTVRFGLNFPVGKTLVLQSNLEFGKNWSNFDGKDYTYFDLGPKLQLVTAF